nr:MAG TPA: hypothetical protein [Caudoviricetes sp.]
MLLYFKGRSRGIVVEPSASSRERLGCGLSNSYTFYCV